MDMLRTVRTESSESYVFFRKSKRIASLDLHFQSSVMGTLVLEKDFSDELLQRLIERIDYEVLSGVSPREDFILSVYRGKEIAFYSDNVSKEARLHESAKAKDIEHVSSLIRKALGKSQAAKGKLNEYVAVEFFRKLGFTAERAGHELDHQKIDVVAEKGGDVTYVQVKSGQISDSEIRKLVASVANIESETAKSVAVLAKSFSVTSELAREELRAKYGMPIHFFDGTQVLETVPEFRHAVG